MDFQVVQKKLIRGAAVGAGSFASTFVGSQMSRFLPFGSTGVSAGKIVLGTGIAVGSEELLGDVGEVPNEAAEFVGYGIQGAGFSELANTFSTASDTGRTVEVRRRQSSDSDSDKEKKKAPYRLDTA